LARIALQNLESWGTCCGLHWEFALRCFWRVRRWLSMEAGNRAGTGTWHARIRSAEERIWLGQGNRDRVGAAAAGAGVLFLALHHRGGVTGCVQKSDDGLRLVDEKRTSRIRWRRGTWTEGRRPRGTQGKKSGGDGGAQMFAPTKMVKKLGSLRRGSGSLRCGPVAACGVSNDVRLCGPSAGRQMPPLDQVFNFY